MSLARRVQFGMRFTENNEPGIEMNPDGTIEVVAPDGSRTPLPGSGLLITDFDADGFDLINLGDDFRSTADFISQGGPLTQDLDANNARILNLAPLVHTTMLSTDPETFLVEHVCDLESVASAYISVTLTSVVEDGETFGAGSGEIAAKVIWEVSRDETTWIALVPNLHATAMVAVDDLIDGCGIVPRFVRVTMSIVDDADVLYAGANAPTAQATLDVEY